MTGYSSIRFTMIEVTAILNVLKHSRDFGQGSAPEDIVSGVISKIEAEAPIRPQTRIFRDVYGDFKEKESTTHPLVDEAIPVCRMDDGWEF